MTNEIQDYSHLYDYLGFAFLEDNSHFFRDLWQEATVDFSDIYESGDSYGLITVGLPPREHRALIRSDQQAKFEEAIQSLANAAIGSPSHFQLPKIYSKQIQDETWRAGSARPIQPSTDEVSRLWKDGHFRLFISHSSSDKVLAAELSSVLENYKIDGFVAHTAIQPNLQWQQQISLALASCHGFVYLATDESNSSCWCQQELGWAIGRGIFTTSYMLKKEARGFAASSQGWREQQHKPVLIAKRLLEMLVKDDRTEPVMRSPLIQLLVNAQNAKQATFALRYLDLVKSMNVTQREALRSLHINELALDDPSVLEKFEALKRRFNISTDSQSHRRELSDPFEDDFDPFEDD